MIDIEKVREALKSRFTGYGDNEMLLCYTEEQRNMVKEALTELERLQKALTQPTQEEVCKALSDYYKEKVEYINHQFYWLMPSGDDLVYQEVKISKLILDKRFDLVTLIGRFYKGETK
jgi:hypothetical protein